MKLIHDLKADQKHLRENYLHSINENDDKSTYDGMVDVNEDESMALV